MPDIFDGQGQSWWQIASVLLAFALSSLIGLERQLHGKSAGISTQAIVGTAAALFTLVSKYGFLDTPGEGISIDPTRVASQIVTGIGFLGAGIILTRRGIVQGLTTAASVWETSAIGMAAATGMWLLAGVVTVLHFVVAYGYRWLSRRVLRPRAGIARLDVSYPDGRGLLRSILTAITAQGWTVSRAEHDRTRDGRIEAHLEVTDGTDVPGLVAEIADIDGVQRVRHVDDEED